MRLRKSIGLWPMMTIFAVLTALLLWANAEIGGAIKDKKWENEQNRLRVLTLEDDQIALIDQLAYVKTDAFIENQARTEYSYMKPDEIRFVIDNPEALFGDGEIPAQE